MKKSLKRFSIAVAFLFLTAIVAILVTVLTNMPIKTAKADLFEPDYEIDISDVMDSPSYGYTFSDNEITFTAVSSDKIYNLTGSTTENRIEVAAYVTGLVLIFENVEMNCGAPLVINADAQVTIFLKESSDNSLVSTTDSGGIRIATRAELTIDGSGKLYVKGGGNAAGLHIENVPGSHENDGILIIENGDISVLSGANGAGIGGNISGSGGSIIINNGTVAAISTHGAGIGGGHSNGANGPNVIINGGDIVAQTTSGAGIGGGYSGDITITGGTVYAYGGYGAGIGGGGYGTGNAGIITITGGIVCAQSAMGAGIGGGSNASGAWGLGADLKVNNDATITAFSKDYIAIDALSISTDNEFYLGIFSLSESISSELSINVFDDSETIVQNLKLPANNISFAFTVFEPTEVSFQASRIVSGTTVYGLVFDGIGPLSDGLGLTFDINGFNEFDAELFDYIVLTFNANGSYFETAGITTKIILLLPDEVFSDNNLIPQIASQTGYNFSGWFYETNAETEFSEDDSFISNKTVYAIWTPYNFTISFDLNYDTIDAIGSFNIDYDASVGILPSPARSGYNFEGWYDNEQSQLQNNTIYNFTQNIILTAQWSPKSFLINFVTDVQFMIIPDKTATYLEQIGILDEPERRGYTFEGWYIDLEDENTKISSESIFYYTNNLTLHAKWSNEASNNTDIYQILTYAFIGTSLSLGLLSLILILKIKRKKV